MNNPTDYAAIDRAAFTTGQAVAGSYDPRQVADLAYHLANGVATGQQDGDGEYSNGLNGETIALHLEILIAALQERAAHHRTRSYQTVI